MTIRFALSICISKSLRVFGTFVFTWFQTSILIAHTYSRLSNMAARLERSSEKAITFF